MKRELLTTHRIFLIIVGIAAAAVLGFIFREPLGEGISRLYYLLTDRERTQTFINTFKGGAPVAFILIQILQVLLAPFPGEATGFVGGYLFGAWQGFIYSSIGLSVGSVLNFVVGRFLGKRYVRKLIRPERMARFDQMLKRQGALIVFLLFVFPGFPKDYLCLFLGISKLPFKVFAIIATIGRMPGTLMLSLQGASVFEQNYTLFVIILGVFGGIAYVGYTYREAFYEWVEKYNNEKNPG
jgi:uncharacterized membrane protein YdjX (TVP38/TMEM64 family)